MALKITNKKAENMVLTESLKLVIAVLCLLLLVYLSWNLYNMFTTKSGLTQAKETMNQIADKIEGLKTGKDDYMIVAPKDWYLIKNEKKLCVCEKKYVLEPADNCCVKGAFRVLEKEFSFDSICSFSPLDRSQPLDYCLYFNPLPITLYFENKENRVIVLTEYSVNAENLFNNLLEFKLTPQEKTVRDLSIDYINRIKVSDKIESSVKEFSKGKDNGIIFQIVEKDISKTWIELRLDNGKDVRTTAAGVYKFEQKASDKFLVVKDLAGKEYSLVLKIGNFTRIGQASA